MEVLQVEFKFISIPKTCLNCFFLYYVNPFSCKGWDGYVVVIRGLGLVFLVVLKQGLRQDSEAGTLNNDTTST